MAGEYMKARDATLKGRWAVAMSGEASHGCVQQATISEVRLSRLHNRNIF